MMKDIVPLILIFLDIGGAITHSISPKVAHLPDFINRIILRLSFIKLQIRDLSRFRHFVTIVDKFEEELGSNPEEPTNQAYDMAKSNEEPAAAAGEDDLELEL